MEYKELAKLYHMNTQPSRETDLTAEEERRRTADSSFSTGFDTPNGELFIAVPRELSVLNERVLRAERRVSRLMREMPPIAGSAILRGLVLDEVVSTNKIERIHSTRRQVRDAMTSISGSDERRFRELGFLYLEIMEGRAVVPNSPEEVRAIFDRVMDGEDPENQGPYGRLFRKDGVDIIGEGERVIHTGLEPESRIIAAMETMLRLVHDDSIPSLYAALASHYIFEYTHPFYDGNGRTGRYLLALFLSDSLSAYTVLSLSRTLAENRNDYYRAFRSVEAPLNRGELTFFVYALLELVRKAQVGIIDRLEANAEAYEKIDGAMREAGAKMVLKDQERELLYMLMQYDAFGAVGDATVEEAANHLGLGGQSARLYLRGLEEKGIVERRRKRNPVTFVLTKAFKEEYGIGERSED